MHEKQPPFEWRDKVEEGEIDRNYLYTTVLGIDVSTCWRQSSAMDYASWYAETFIFKGKGKEREWIGDATGIGHFAAVNRILELGEWKEIDDDKI